MCAWLLSAPAWAAHYTGTYAAADGATIELAHDAQGTFTGRWHTQQSSFALVGQAADDHGGEFVVEVQGERVPFDIALSPDGMTLTVVLRSNGAQFEFRRQSHDVSLAPPDRGAEHARNGAADPYVGAFRDAQIAVVLEGGGECYTGLIESSGQAYPVQLQASGEVLVGTFQVGQDRFEVQMALQGDTLVVRTGAATYQLARHGVGSAVVNAHETSQAAVLDTLRVRTVTIMDEAGFDRPRPELTSMVPHDWTAVGGAAWRPALSCIVAPQAYFATASDDETFRIATIARETWTIANFPTDPVPQGCMLADTGAVGGYLHAWIERERPGARVLSYRDLPDIAAAYEPLLVNDPATGLRSWAEVGEITYAFELQGSAVHERIVAVVVTIESLTRTVDGTVLGYRSSNSSGTVIRAPAGQLDTFGTLASTLIGLVRMDPD